MEKVKELLENEIKGIRPDDIDYYCALIDTLEYVRSVIESKERTKQLLFVPTKDTVIIDNRIPF